MESSEDTEEIDLEEDVIEEPADAIFDGRKGYVGGSDADRISQQGFYGTRTDDNRLELEPVELLHLIERKRLVVKKPDGETIGPDYIVSELLDDDPDLWTR
jgi:tRNA splicing endonuclease